MFELAAVSGQLSAVQRQLFLTFRAVAPRQARGRNTVRRTAAAGPRRATARHAAAHVAVRPIALELLPAAPGAVAEPVRTRARVSNREIRRRTSRGRLPFRTRQRRANQRPVDRAFLDVAF